MGHQQSLFDTCRGSLILLVTLALSTVCLAGNYEFHLSFSDNVPGMDKYRAGDLDAAIEILESRVKVADNQYLGKELANLCGFYIVKRNFAAARETCSSAVEVGPSSSAYNNRAILRVLLGDTVGALEDFDRVRVIPENQPRYIEQLKRDDGRLVASRNFVLATELIERGNTNKRTMAGDNIGANIEDIVH